METISRTQPINLKVVRFEVDFSKLMEQPKQEKKKAKKIRVPQTHNVERRLSNIPAPPVLNTLNTKKDVKQLIEELLEDLYSDPREWSSSTGTDYRGSISAASVDSSMTIYDRQNSLDQLYLEDLDENIIKENLCQMEDQVLILGQRLGRCVRTRDRLRRQQKRLCAAVSVLLRRLTGDHNARFGLAPSAGTEPGCGEGGFAEWLHAMRLVARLPAGVPHHFRKKLWVSLAERHFLARGVDWPAAERACFRGTAQPDDTELGAQILKDLHRTGCSLFCGAEGRENQAMLRRVLLAYARWNKDVGYCQGFNMLAAIILEVMDKSESDSLKVMIYLVEAVLPEGYFADDLRGLSADMAAFRDLLKLRLPRLANHMDHLQKISDGGGVEPPLPDVFTMQWFLTLYATWLPREALLRIWDLVLLDGNEVLLLTALAIWDLLQDRILSARSADEYYSCMGGGAGAVWEASEALVAKVVSLGSAPELPRLRSAHRYRVAPPQAAQPLHSAMQSMTRRGLRLFYSEDEGDSSDDGNKMALATVMIPRREEQAIAGERLSLDIGALKRQYARLRERQRQAHVILAAACARHAAVGIPTSPTSLTVNNLLLGKSAIVSNRGRRLGPPPGAIPPSRSSSEKHDQRTRIPGSETISWNEEKSRKTLSRRNSLKWKDVKKQKAVERIRKASIDLDEAGDGIIVSEREANEMIASVRSRSSSETSSYSSRSETSSDTSLCDDNARDSDSEPELPADKEKIEEKIVPENVETPCKVDVEPSKSTSPIYKNNVDEHSSSTLDINKYIETPAGEPLRTYIGGFESKLQESVMKSTDNKDVYRFLDLRDKSLSPPLNKCSADFPELANIDLMEDLQRMAENNNVKYTQKSPRAYAKHSTNVTELSPIELSPCNHKFISPLEYTFSSQQNITSKTELLGRESPDIISFSKNPIVTDIDLSDKNMSDIDSPPRSPGAESIIVSEDEPPIPLKIDKYFEHSPEFFGARYTITDSLNSDFSSRRPPKRHFRIPKKPDSLTLHCNNNDKLKVEEEERASSLPQSLKFSPTTHISPECRWSPKPDESFYKAEPIQVSPKENMSTPLKDIKQEITKNNSERALQIIQENSKILSRILTKHQNNIKSVQENTNGKIPTTTAPELAEADTMTVSLGGTIPDASTLKNISPLESLVRYRKKLENKDFNDFLRTRPISIDDPISLGKSMSLLDKAKLSTDNKSPSSECLANKTDLYGWENKGFQAKSDYASFLTKPEDTNQNNKSKTPDFSTALPLSETKEISTSEWRNYSLSGQRKSDNNTSTPKDFKISSPYDRKVDSNDSCYQFSNKYNNTSLTKVNDLGNRTIGQGRDYENIHKTDDSQATDFAHIVTSSISFTYEESAEDDSPFGAKSNSSDTLCQITSLDQVSTPISPKIFPKEHTVFPRDLTDKSDRVKLESDDTCSTITSLVETDTLSSLSYPRSPSTGSYHHFPTRPSMRMPKEIGIRLGMYPKDSISSPQK